MSGIKAEGRRFVFTGWHMLIIMIAFFGVIISVNVVMAFFATSTWSGLVVKNSYVASQEFNEKQAAGRKWLASGIKGEVRVAGDVVSYRLTGPKGEPVAAERIEVAFRRPVGDRQDFAIELAPVDAGRFEAPHAVRTGEWIVDLTAWAGTTVVFHEARRLHVGDGAI